MSTISDLLNQTNVAQTMGKVQFAILNKMLQSILATNSDQQELGGKDDKRSLVEQDRYILNSVGPAAATCAMEFALNATKDRFSGVSFNGSLVNNVRLIQNQVEPQYQGFSTVLRQFLLPRYAYLDFDRVVDPRHRIDEECGYPRFITPIMYRYMYDRDDVANRVNDIFPDESWAVDPLIYETEDETNWTPFELAWQGLCDEFNILQYLYRLDRLSGIGHYGALLLGIDDGRELDQPIEGIREDGTKNPDYKKEHKLLYLRPFDEYLSFIQSFERDVNSPRYGLPTIYNLVFVDMTIDAAGASIGTRLNRRVHWSRVVHVADNLQSSLVFGTPRMQAVFNRLLDLRKIKGGSAEMFWKGGFPGISFELDPNFVADNPEFDKDAFRDEIQRYSEGLQRYMINIGVKANSLSPQIANPDKHVGIQVQAIAMRLGIPLRIFLGSEEGRLASSQDKLTWNQRLGRRLKTFVEPSLIRPFVNRLLLLNILPPPKKRYVVEWADLNTPTDEDKANLSLKWTQALSQYVATGIIHLIKPMDYLTLIMGLRPSQAKRIVDAMEREGGFQKLLKVDPSQGAGVNGKRENITNPKESGTSRSRPKKRNTADKKAEGKTSG